MLRPLQVGEQGVDLAEQLRQHLRRGQVRRDSRPVLQRVSDECILCRLPGREARVDAGGQLHRVDVEVEHSRHVCAHARGRDHKPKLTHGGVSQNFLNIKLGEGNQPGQNRRRCADIRHQIG